MVFVEKKEVITEFVQKLCDSGYDHQTKMVIRKSAFKKFYRQVIDQEAGGQRNYKSSSDMAQSRRLKPLLTKNCLKSRIGGEKITAGKNLPEHQREQEKNKR